MHYKAFVAASHENMSRSFFMPKMKRKKKKKEEK